jgi:hypothetical protein
MTDNRAQLEIELLASDRACADHLADLLSDIRIAWSDNGGDAPTTELEQQIRHAEALIANRQRIENDINMAEGGE